MSYYNHTTGRIVETDEDISRPWRCTECGEVGVPDTDDDGRKYNRCSCIDKLLSERG